MIWWAPPQKKGDGPFGLVECHYNFVEVLFFKQFALGVKDQGLGVVFHGICEGDRKRAFGRPSHTLGDHVDLPRLHCRYEGGPFHVNPLNVNPEVCSEDVGDVYAVAQSLPGVGVEEARSLVEALGTDAQGAAFPDPFERALLIGGVTFVGRLGSSTSLRAGGEDDGHSHDQRDQPNSSKPTRTHHLGPPILILVLNQ